MAEATSAQWSLFAVIWDLSQVLADEVDGINTDHLRFLEVGWGVGLSSLLLNAKNATITATDCHPQVGEFLFGNSQLNADRNIPFFRTD